jgi:hypothetical protein
MPKRKSLLPALYKGVPRFAGFAKEGPGEI